MAQYQLTDPSTAGEHTTTLIADLRDCPIPELTPLGRALHTWRTELLGRFEHPAVTTETSI